MHNNPQYIFLFNDNVYKLAFYIDFFDNILSVNECSHFFGSFALNLQIISYLCTRNNKVLFKV